MLIITDHLPDDLIRPLLAVWPDARLAPLKSARSAFDPRTLQVVVACVGPTAQANTGVVSLMTEIRTLVPAAQGVAVAIPGTSSEVMDTVLDQGFDIGLVIGQINHEALAWRILQAQRRAGDFRAEHGAGAEDYAWDAEATPTPAHAPRSGVLGAGFAGFLVANGWITPAKVLAGLSHQDRSEPSVLEILHGMFGLDAGTCIQLAVTAEQEQVSPAVVAIRQGLIPADALPGVLDAIERSRPSIARSLVDLGHARPGPMRDWLFSYMGHVQPEPISKTYWGTTSRLRPAVSLEPAGTTTGEPSQDLVCEHELLPATEPIVCDASVLGDYREFLNDDLRAALENRILALKDTTPESLPPLLDHLYRDLHSMKGSANFIGAKATTHAIHHIEDIISLVKRQPKLAGIAQLQELMDLMFKSLDLVWDLREAILTRADEGPRLHEIAVSWHEHHRRVANYLSGYASRMAAVDATTVLADQF